MSCTAVRVTLPLVSFILLASPARAIPLTWNLSDVLFEDGSTAIGSFVFNADLDVYSDVSVITPRASYETGELFGGFSSLQPPGHLVLVDGLGAGSLVGKPLLILAFEGGLTNSGGTVALVLGSGPPHSGEDICVVPDCLSIGLPPEWRIVSGSVTAAVPELASLTLLGLGLTVITATRRWRSNRATL